MKPRAALPSEVRLAALLLLLPGLYAASAGAFDWSSLGANCKGVKLPEFSRYLEGAKAWEALQERTRGEIRTLSGQVCPEYLQSANGAAGLGAGKKLTLEAYIARHTSTFRDAGETTGQAREGEKYLSTEFDRINGIHASVGWDFANSSCGTSITAARKHYASVITTVRALAAETGEKCARISAELASLGPEKKEPPRAGPGAPAIPGSPAHDPSRITGEITPEKLSSAGGPRSPLPGPGTASLPPAGYGPSSSAPTADASGSSLPGEKRSPRLAREPASTSAGFSVESFGHALGSEANPGGPGRSEEYVVSSLLAGESPSGHGKEGEIDELVATIAQLSAAEAGGRAGRVMRSAADKQAEEASVFELVRHAIRKRQQKGAI